jgi:hypothetical protein
MGELQWRHVELATKYTLKLEQQKFLSKPCTCAVVIGSCSTRAACVHRDSACTQKSALCNIKTQATAKNTKSK